MCVYTNIYICVYINIYRHIYIYLSTYISPHTHTYACMCICMLDTLRQEELYRLDYRAGGKEVWAQLHTSD